MMRCHPLLRRGLSGRSLAVFGQPLNAKSPLEMRSFSSDGGRSTDQKQIKEDFDYCVNLVRERDMEGFFCGLLLPSKSQRAYFALRAFNVELASVKGAHNLRRKPEGGGLPDTPTTLALQMRMQWWKDAIKEIYGDSEVVAPTNPTLLNLSISCWNSPIVRALDVAHQQVGFTRRFLDRLIDARTLDLDVQQLITLDESINYAEQTVSSLLYLTLETVGVREDEADEVASYAGIGIGLTTLLRATPFRLVHDEIPLPIELLPPSFPYGQLFEETPSLSEEEASLWASAIEQMAATAEAHFYQMRKLQANISRAARPTLLPVVPARQFLQRLQATQNNLMDAKLHEPQRLSLLLGLGRSWLVGSV